MRQTDAAIEACRDAQAIARRQADELERLRAAEAGRRAELGSGRN